MISTLLLSLISNILIKINYIKQDFIGINFDLNILFNLIFGFSFSLALLIISYLIGTRIRRNVLGISFIQFDNLIDIA
jgi:hypothetical protein